MYSGFVRNASQACRLAGAIVLLGACDRSAVGKPFPELALTGGIDFFLGFRGKLLVFNVRATWCPQWRREMPGLEWLSNSVVGMRIVAASISIDKDANAVREFLTQNDITYFNS